MLIRKNSGRLTLCAAVVGQASQLSHPDLACLVFDAAVLVAGPAALDAVGIVSPVQGAKVAPCAKPLLLLDVFGGPARGAPTVTVAAEVDIVLAGGAAVGVARGGGG